MVLFRKTGRKSILIASGTFKEKKIDAEEKIKPTTRKKREEIEKESVINHLRRKGIRFGELMCD